MGIKDNIIFQEDIYCECACECFVRIQVNEYDTDRIMSVNYIQPLSNDGIFHQTLRYKIKRAWAALRGKDWMPGFELYDTESAKDLALAVQKAAMVVLYGRDFPLDNIHQT